MAMRLELNILRIKDVRFAEKTSVNGGVLAINRNALRQLLLEDKRLADLDLVLAHPGEKCRIARVIDVIEPRAKASGQDFPGALGAHVSAGSGATCVLRGGAVT